MDLDGTCPHCGRAVRFLPVGNQHVDRDSTNAGCALVCCPVPECSCVSYVEFVGQYVVRVMPEARRQFPDVKVPPIVHAAFDEALVCASHGCNIAAAMLVRRTLECLCEDRGAPGGSLRDRVEALRSKVIIPEELFKAMHDIRLLGNDAAHVESKDYTGIGKPETDAALALCEQLLMATYGYSGLLAKLGALKKPT